jgi:hypothetical protein
MTQDEMIEALICDDIEEIVNDVRQGRTESPGDLRHLFYAGCLGYMNWMYEDIAREYRRRMEYREPKSVRR